MPRIRLVHWNAGEAAPRLAFLKKAGYTVDFGPLDPDVVRAIKTKPPDAFVIDLSRAPSHGREVAASFRQSKPTRFVPLVFVDGDPEKVEGIRKVLPDATYTGWNRIRSDLKKALAARPTTVATPPIIGYSGTPLPKKLGIKEDSIVALVGAPDGFEEILGELPRTVTVARKRSSKTISSCGS